MLVLFLLLLVPLGNLALPNTFLADPLVLQLPISPNIVSETPTSIDAAQHPMSPVVEINAGHTSKPIVKLIYQFKKERFENLAVRRNGQLLLDCINFPQIHTLDPNKHHPKPSVLHEFTNVTSTLGIAEISPDVFAVVVGNWTQPGKHEPGSFSIWSIDLNGQEPITTLITPIPDANALNGLTALDGSPDIVLAADSVLGLYWVVNITERTYHKGFQSPLWENLTATGIGINGVRTYAGALHFYGSAQGLYGRIALHPNGSAAGEVEILARLTPPLTWDDFDLDWEGNAWVTTHPDAFSEVTVQGKQRSLWSDSVDLTEPTSARFGHGDKKHTLYMTTSGNMSVAGQLFAVDTCRL